MIVFISTSTFAEFDTTPVKTIKEAGLDVKFNPYGRKLTGAELVKSAASAIGLIAGTETLDSNIFRQLPRLKVISRCGAGMDCVDLESANKFGIKVFNTPDAPTLAVADNPQKIKWLMGNKKFIKPRGNFE